MRASGVRVVQTSWTPFAPHPNLRSAPRPTHASGVGAQPYARLWRTSVCSLTPDGRGLCRARMKQRQLSFKIKR